MVVTWTAGGGSASTPGTERAASSSMFLASVGGLAKATWSETTTRWSGSGALWFTTRAPASSLFGTTMRSPLRSRMREVRQLMSTTTPSESPAVIQSPVLNGRSLSSRTPEASPLSVSCRAKETTSEVTPRAVRAADRSTPQTPPMTRPAVTMMRARRGRASTRRGTGRRPSPVGRERMPSPTTRSICQPASATESTSPVATSRRYHASLSTARTGTSRAHPAKNGSTQLRTVFTGGSSGDSDCRSRSLSSAAPTMTVGTTRMTAMLQSTSLEGGQFIGSPRQRSGRPARRR